MHNDLLSEIDAYCSARGITPQTFGRLAGQGGNFYNRLRDGRRAWPETVAKVRKFMVDNPAVKRAGAA